MTSHPEFHANTEGLQAAKVFPERIRGKTFLVTGINKSGIGYAISEALASQSPAHLILASRTAAKVQECIDDLRERFPEVDYRFLQVDLSSQSSVRHAAEEVLAWDIASIDIVINSAAVMCLQEKVITDDGVEMQLATNYVGHYLLTCLLMPKLIKSAEGRPAGSTRVINMTARSPEYSAMRWSDTNFNVVNEELPQVEQPSYQLHRMWGVADPEKQSYIPIEGYNQSKVANVLFSIALNERLFAKYGILSIATHPGILATELKRNMDQATLDAIDAMAKVRVNMYKSLRAGASTSLVAALDPKLGLPRNEILPEKENPNSENYGVYMADCQISSAANPLAVSSSEAERLWAMSEKLVKERFAW